MALRTDLQLRSSGRLLWIAIGIALVCGGALRLAWNDGPFPSSDHAELAAIVTYFYPRSLAAFTTDPPLTWSLLLSAHGALAPLIGLASMTLVGLAGIPITEWWWNLPFVVAGLVTIVLGARFAATLAGNAAGIIAAILLALLPIHAVLSRASGLSHITLMGLCQLAAIWCFARYYEQPTPRRARVAGLVLSVALLVELFFPVLLALLFAVGVLCVREEAGFWRRVTRARRLFFAPAVMIGPLLVIAVTAMVMVAYAARLIAQGGIISRLFQGSDRRVGVYFEAFWINGAFVAGTAGFGLLLALAALGIPALLRLERRAVPLLWAATYLLPLLLLTRANVYGYFLMGALALTLNAAIVLSALWRRAPYMRAAASAITLMLVVALALRCGAIIYGFSFGGLIGEGVAQGGIFPDQGLKTASWWVRSTTSADTRVFVAGMFEPYQIWYYVRRPAIAVTDAVDAEESYRALAGQAVAPALYIVPPEQEALLFSYVPERPRLALIVTNRGRPILHVYGATDGAAPIQLEAIDGNQRFDREFGRFGAMFSFAGER